MELRRALLLFAIVLGVAAVVTSLSAPARTDRSDRPADPPPQRSGTPPPSSGAAPVVRFDADRAATTKTLRAGRAGTVTVSSETAGDVRIESLGLDAVVEPGTAARFDLYETEPGRHRMRFDASGGVRERSLGVLAIQPAR